MSVEIRPIAVDVEVAAEMVSLSLSVFKAEVRAGNAPKPRQISPRRAVYLVAELEAWAQSRPVSQMAPPPNAGKNAGKYRQKSATGGEA